MGRMSRTLFEHGQHHEARSTVKGLRAEMNKLKIQQQQSDVAIMKPFITAIEAMLAAADEYREDPAFLAAAQLIKVAKGFK